MDNWVYFLLKVDLDLDEDYIVDGPSCIKLVLMPELS